jgi:phosphoenolpyruvate carboxylase
VHLQTKESGEQLRRRINELLRSAAAGDSETDQNLEDLEDFDPYDSTHLFWDQLKYLGFSLREIRREDVTDEEIDELLKASEPVLNVLAKIQRRKEKKPVIKLRI